MFRLCIVSLCFLSAVAHAQDIAEIPEAVRDNVELLVQEGLDDAVGYAFVRGLTTEVGSRLAGSDAEERARIWATRELAELGFSNVRTEPFMIPYWSRRVDRASVVSPAPDPRVATSRES